MHYGHKLHLRLSVDASGYQVGAVLSHNCEDGSERPIALLQDHLAVLSVYYIWGSKVLSVLVWEHVCPDHRSQTYYFRP